MFFKKNYFVEFEYEGPEENGGGSVVVRCLPSELIKATDEIKKTLEHMKIKVDRIFITKIKRV
ncbi:hypothetical protein [Clostridium butyricum]|uniref:hypothetical protein n=1 Tax=Clostridium butyricum TaxID=1492 RepID=UPI002AAFA140|nr:hypothetical protein [Clostridium butyricum]